MRHEHEQEQEDPFTKIELPQIVDDKNDAPILSTETLRKSLLDGTHFDRALREQMAAKLAGEANSKLHVASLLREIPQLEAIREKALSTIPKPLQAAWNYSLKQGIPWGIAFAAVSSVGAYVGAISGVLSLEVAKGLLNFGIEASGLYLFAYPVARAIFALELRDKIDETLPDDVKRALEIVNIERAHIEQQDYASNFDRKALLQASLQDIAKEMEEEAKADLNAVREFFSS